MPKYVVSTTLQESDLVTNWNEINILRSMDDVAALKETDGGPIIVHGSARLGANLADAGLVDRYHLLVFPVLLGAGKRLFSSTDKDKQMLTWSRASPTPTACRSWCTTSSGDRTPPSRTRSWLRPI